MDAEYRGLGFDPAPGSVEAVAAASDRLGRAGRHAASAVPAVTSAGDAGDGWSGRAAGEFGTRLAQAPSELGRAQDVLLTASGILDDWAGTLRSHQRTADRLDREALELRRAVERAEDDVRAARTALQVAIGTAARTAAADHAAALARQAALQVDLDKVLEAARVLERDHLAAAQRVAERLRVLGGDGVEAGGELVDGGLLDRITRTVGAYSHETGELSQTLFGGGGFVIPPQGGASRAAGALTSR